MFNSQKASELRDRFRTAGVNTSAEEYRQITSDLLDLVCELAVEADMLRLSVDEANEKADAANDNLEYINSNLQTIRDRIVGEISVDTDEYTAHLKDGSGHDRCSCGHHHPQEDEELAEDDGNPDASIYFNEEEEEYVTLQCSWCEELFFIEKHEGEGMVECPFCHKNVNISDCAVE